MAFLLNRFNLSTLFGNIIGNLLYYVSYFGYFYLLLYTILIVSCMSTLSKHINMYLKHLKIINFYMPLQ